jgi:hypothetical protein
MMEDIKKAAVWQEALDLASAVVQLCEQFTDDQNVLAGHLRGLAIDIPASIASDLSHKREPNADPLVRCAIVLELVKKVYPAIDTEAVESGIENIMARIEKNTFTEVKASAPATPVVEPSQIGAPAPVPPEKTPEDVGEPQKSSLQTESESSPSVISINQES